MKKEAIFFKRQSVILKTNSFDHEGDRLCTFQNSLRRLRYFRCCRFLLFFRFLHLFSLFPRFLTLCKSCICRARRGHHNGRIHLQTLSRVLVVPLEGIRSYGGRTKADALHHFKPIIVQRFELPRFPAYVLPNMVSSRKSIAVSMVDRENNIEFIRSFVCVFEVSGKYFQLVFGYLHFIIEFVEDLCRFFVSSRARFDNMFVLAER